MILQHRSGLIRMDGGDVVLDERPDRAVSILRIDLGLVVTPEVGFAKGAVGENEMLDARRVRLRQLGQTQGGRNNALPHVMHQDRVSVDTEGLYAAADDGESVGADFEKAVVQVFGGNGRNSAFNTRFE